MYIKRRWRFIPMSNKAKIKSNVELFPKIYAYTIPDLSSHEGWIKIGYTERDVETRIKEQVGTAGIAHKTLWSYDARFQSGGGLFTDREFHKYLKRNNIKRRDGTELFYFNGDLDKAKKMFQQFVFAEEADPGSFEENEYILRKEQKEAVDKTLNYFNSHTNGEFLWNAKPRFGKTLATYDLARKLKARNVLVVTNRPAIANSWYDDYEKFIAWQTSYLFISESDSLKERNSLSREEFIRKVNADIGKEYAQIVFVSLQDLKGAKCFGGEHEKLRWLKGSEKRQGGKTIHYPMEWDLLVIDEAHEAVDTYKTERAFNVLTAKNTLHLSGTPFKAIANDKFSENQIFTWTYEDEQNAKENWNYEIGSNPYEELPVLNLFTYKLSQMITDQVNKGAILDEGEATEYAFDLNEFFETNNNGEFTHKEDIKRFLDRLTENEKYPYSTEELRDELRHTLWLLNRVASAKALAKLLKDHPVFGEYEIIIAAGDGKSPEDEAEDFSANESSLKKVQQAIAEFDKTITLSVGQLTTGVTIPEWSAVMMLSNIKSPALYMQAAFRSQNKNVFIGEADGSLKRKENAYVFDFAPERTLILFDEFANNLKKTTAGGGGTSEEREANIKRLLNFFPVIAEDEEGKMVELDAKKVLTIPHQIKAYEVVRRGFMSNFLFANISGIFGAPKIVLDTLNQLKPEKEGKVLEPKKPVDVAVVDVDEEGNVKVDQEIVINKTDAIFGDKKIEICKIRENITYGTFTPEKFVNDISKKVAESATPDIDTLKENFEDVRKADVNKIQKQIEVEVQQEVRKATLEFESTKQELEDEYAEREKDAITDNDKKQILLEKKSVLSDLLDTYKETIDKSIDETLNQIQERIVHDQVRRQEERKKDSIEDDVRSRLRGFSRTIPSFLMAYGDDDLELANFDEYTPDEVFHEITGITGEQFRFLRDGGEYIDEETGEEKNYPGQLFDEIVFNQSIKEFMNKRRELSDYFDESLEEDIYDYIPLQKTNLKFTPKWVAKLMVEILEKESPELFENPETKFLDPYIKSGLFSAEIAKRLFNSPKMQELFPDDNERIKHILENQVYGCAPNDVLKNIATNFVFGLSTLQGDLSKDNIVDSNMEEPVKRKEMKKQLEKEFGDMKFDVIIGNPPYQIEAQGTSTSDDPIYNNFMEESYQMAERVMFITPSRFLFNAGKTPKTWNQKMLNDAHLKVVYFEQDSSKVFPNTDIKGGIVVTYRDVHQKFGAIGTFTHFDELNSILRKVEYDKPGFEPITNVIFTQSKFKLDVLYEDYPGYKDIVGSDGKDKRLRKPILNRLDIFTIEPPEADWFKILGRVDNQRTYRYIPRKYIDKHENILKYKVLVPAANGTGTMGEVLSTPLIGEPFIGHTDTFISFGAFDNEHEAEAMLKYIKTKFCRTMLGVLKITQDNTADKWAKVPMQNFSSSSDIDWKKPVSEIDRQLYIKYGLNEEEMDFIEKKIKPMK